MNRLSSFIGSWLSHRKALLELLKVVNDEQLSFKPWEKGMSFSELTLHISGSTSMFVNTVKTGVFTPPTNNKEVSSTQELIEWVEAQTENVKQELEALTEEQLNSIIAFAGMDLPGMVILELAKDHEIHHKGQLFTYARLLGIEEVPFFIYRP
ncbi:DinB family protein [Robertmurraya korlensis]|uniref:DinB family protein n=1 Tax=Robertmurraya korlensis TaxID=519977 RepID=UPI000825CADA|nr:DinB family protein [Robertmurraya korlensis]